MVISYLPMTAQLIRQDDFQSKNNYWFWRSDGNQSKPTVENGLVHLILQNAVDSFYCNTEFYDPTKPYEPGTQVRVRLRTSEIHYGSRGWGLWDGDLDSSILVDYDIAWIMQQSSQNSNQAYNWSLFGVNGDKLANTQSLDLNNLVDETKWHTYQINWEINKVSLLVDNNLLFETFSHLPDENMRLDIWIDNRVLNIIDPSNFWNNNVEISEIFVDYVEISGREGPSIPRTIGGNIILWKSPNTFPIGEKNTLWKQYVFSTESDGEALIFLTGSAESYGKTMEDDDLKIVLDNNDYEWNTSQSLDGNHLNGKGASIVLPVEILKGQHSLDIYTDVTPFLSDVIVVYSKDSKTIYNKNFNEAANGNIGLWKTIEFDATTASEIAILISGLVNENDEIRIELDNNEYGGNGKEIFTDNNSAGIPNTVVLNEVIEPGSHSLKIYSKGNPQLYSIAVYGGSTVTNILDEVTLSESISFKVNPNPFNISTNIYYKTNNSSHNKISIFNILGQKVETLVNKYQQKGEYTLQWNAIGETSGIFFCILEADNYFRVEKLLLLK